MAINVMHVIQELNVGGAERVVANYVKHHDRAQFMPQVCAISEGGAVADEIESYGVKVTVLGKKPGLDLCVLPKLRHLLRSENIKILHLHNPPANNWGVPASILNNGIVTVRTEHNVFYKGRVVWGYPAINSILGFFNKKIITVSDEVKRSHFKKDFLFRKKYITIYNGIEGVLYNKQMDISHLRKELNIKTGVQIVGKIASLSKQKAHGNFLNAASLILKDVPDTIFLVVGDGKLRREVEGRAIELGIRNHIIFTGVRKDIPELLNLMDVFVLSSDWEGLPMTILEAMAAGRPCVVTDVGGNREAVIDGETGFLVPPQNPDALAKSIIRLLKDKDMSKRFGERGQARFEKEFTVEMMVSKTEELYRQYLKQ